MFSNRLLGLTLLVVTFFLAPASSSSQSSSTEQTLTSLILGSRSQAEHRRVIGAEIERLFREDQAQGPENLMPEPQRQAWFAAHQMRISRMREIVRTEPLETIPDLFNAASLLQHGIAPDDFLTAHVLYETAALKGSMAARGLAAGALDRYLLWSGRPAIFTLVLGGENLITDDLRKFHCVRPVAEQSNDSPNWLRECTPTVKDYFNEGRPN